MQVDKLLNRQTPPVSDALLHPENSPSSTENLNNKHANILLQPHPSTSRSSTGSDDALSLFSNSNNCTTSTNSPNEHSENGSYVVDLKQNQPEATTTSAHRVHGDSVKQEQFDETCNDTSMADGAGNTTMDLVANGVKRMKVEIEGENVAKFKEEDSEETNGEELKHKHKQKQTRKKKKTHSSLAGLLADADWYTTSFEKTTRQRTSSLKYELLKQKQEEERKLAREQEESDRELSEGELLEIERRKMRRRENQARYKEQKQLEKKKLEERRMKAKERTMLIKAGLYQSKRKPGNSTNYYSGSTEADKLLKATKYFTNLGLDDEHEFDPEDTRERKEVDRYKPELAEVRKKMNYGRKRHLKSLQKKVASSIKVVEPKKPKAIKKKKKKSSKTPTPPPKEPTPTPPPPPPPTPWFTDIENEKFIKISDRRFFLDCLYELKNLEDIQQEQAPIQASAVIDSKLTVYELQNQKWPITEVYLQYPFSNYKEHYKLALSKNDSEFFNPFDELGRTMEIIAFGFMPDDERRKVINLENPDDCIIGRYTKAFEEDNLEALTTEIQLFNNLVVELNANGKMLEYSTKREEFPIVVIYEILNQCYTRSVLPEANKLKHYKAFSNFVYGELMPSFLSTVYKKCHLDNTKVFIDLGSGVGNCTIQAALECGAESYGCELAANASDLGDEQLIEFSKRSKLLGLNLPFINLFNRQSFVDNPAVRKVVDKSDVLLINNYLFDSELNRKIVELIQELKVGAKIISLKPIVPPGFTYAWDPLSILAKLKTEKHIYEEDSVSWTSNGGYYYLSEVMPYVVIEKDVTFKTRSRTESSRLTQDENRERSNTPMNIFTNNV